MLLDNLTLNYQNTKKTVSISEHLDKRTKRSVIAANQVGLVAFGTEHYCLDYRTFCSVIQAN